MCGISGIYSHRDRLRAEAVVMQMNDCIAHRGPDAQGLWSNDSVALGHRRLSIIDTSEAGNQPFFSQDKKLVVVFNGEIYNYLELKKELSSDYTFTTATDTEVLLAAYKRWGIECIKRFYGMFGFALYDTEKETLFVVRDRLGIKPVYYSETSEGLLFASELRAILSSGLVEKKIGHQAMTDYLRYQTVHAPNTIIADIKLLMPGHYMKFDKSGVQHISYWNAINNSPIHDNTEGIVRVKKRVQEILMSSVEIRMRADVPFGAFLSGGIDSSIIVGLMSEISSQQVKTFSVTFHEKEFDESPYSSLVAKKFNTDHTPIQLSANDFLKLIPDALQAMDHPSGDGPNTYVVSKVTREAGVKMALSGLGGDELFAGYDVFTRMKDIENRKWLRSIPQGLRSLAGKMLLKRRPSISSEKIASALSQEKFDFAHIYPLTRQVLSDSTVQSLLKNKSNGENAVYRAAIQAASSRLAHLSKVSVAEIETYMQNVLLRDTDQMSMAHALEIRVPFLDHRLVEYVLGVSDSIKYPHTPKQLLTESFADLIPSEVIHRPKMGFTFPWAVWMRGELKSFCENNISALQQVDTLNYTAVQNLWKRFLQNDPFVTWSRVWPLVVLGHWVKQHDVH